MNPAELEAEDAALRRLAQIQGESNWSPDDTSEAPAAERLRAALVAIEGIARAALSGTGGK